MNMRTTLSPELQAFSSKRANEESILWSWYHYKNLPASALPSPLTFFTLAQGQTDPDISAAMSGEDSNMKQGGALPRTNRFLCNKIRVPLGPSTATAAPVSGAPAATEVLEDEIVRMIYRGRLIFTIMTKPYLELAPLGEFGAGYGPSGAFALTAFQTATYAKAFVTNGVPSHDQGRRVAIPIAEDATFDVKIDFPKSTFTPAVVFRMGVVLDGLLFRPQNS
jgi:hypothetical protein